MSGEKKYPNLRFPGFKGDWKSSPLSEITDKIQDGTHFSPEIIEDKERLYITSKNIRMGRLDLSSVSYISQEAHDAIYKRCDVKFGDVLLTKDGASTGNVCINTIEDEFSLLSSVAFIRASAAKASSHFIYQILSSTIGQREIIRSIAGQAITRITLEKLRAYQFYFPPVPEQKKIADFLGAVDGKLSALREKEAALTRFKRGLMQALFSQTLRFTLDDGSSFPDWEKKRLGDALRVKGVRNRKNEYSKDDVLSVSGDAGIVNQIEHLGRSYAGELVHDYHVVETGDIVYTKSPLKLNPYGIIKGNRGPAGIVSTLYAVYEVRSGFSYEYLDRYFELDDNTNRYLRPLVHKGAKNDMKISSERVLIDPIMFPCLEEQEKIADVLSSMDAKITAVNDQIVQFSAFKKGLLQQMFV